MIELKKELNNKAIENREERVSMGQFIEIGLGIDYKGDKIDESDSFILKMLKVRSNSYMY